MLSSEPEQPATNAEDKENKVESKNNNLLALPAKPKIYSENSFIVDEQLAEDECLCEVCCDLMDSKASEDPDMSCRHKVCFRCWKLHLTTHLQYLGQQENLSHKVITVCSLNLNFFHLESF